jgi:hypothetical protein
MRRSWTQSWRCLGSPSARCICRGERCALSCAGLSGWESQTPFAPAHFLSRDHLGQSPTVIEDEFGFRPQTLREVLDQTSSGLFAVPPSAAR